MQMRAVIPGGKKNMSYGTLVGAMLKYRKACVTTAQIRGQKMVRDDTLKESKEDVSIGKLKEKQQSNWAGLTDFIKYTDHQG